MPREALDAPEITTFETEYDDLTTVWSAEQADERIREIFAKAKPFVREAVEYAKAEFQGGFHGIDAQGGFGWQLLRPEHIKRLTTDGATVNRDWKRTAGPVATFNDWVATSTTMNTINRRAYIVLIGLVNHEPVPKSVGMQLRVNNIIYPPWTFHWAMKVDRGLTVWPFPKPKAIPPLGNVYATLFDEATGSDEVQMLGITFGEATYLQTLAPTIETP